MGEQPELPLGGVSERQHLRISVSQVHGVYACTSLRLPGLDAAGCLDHTLDHDGECGAPVLCGAGWASRD